MTLTLVPRLRTCPDWCTQHDDEVGICSSATIVIDTPDAPPWMIQQLAVSMSADDHDGVTVLLTGDGHGGNTSLDGAERYALAILDKVAAARGGAS